MEKIKRISAEIEVKEFIITFNYETWKSKKRKEDKRTVKHINLEEARKSFKTWSKTIRTMSNVEILDIAELKENTQVIEL